MHFPDANTRCFQSRRAQASWEDGRAMRLPPDQIERLPQECPCSTNRVEPQPGSRTHATATVIKNSNCRPIAAARGRWLQRRLGDGSERLDESVVVRVRADEIPQSRLARPNTDSAPVETDARRENWLGRVNLFELETRVPRVARPSAVCLESLFLDMGRKVRKELSEPFILVRVQVETNYPRPGADAPHARGVRGQARQPGFQSPHYAGHV